MYLIVKIILLELAFALSASVADKPQYLINGTLDDLQKLLNWFNGAVTVAFFRTPFVLSLTAFPALYSKDLK